MGPAFYLVRLVQWASAKKWNGTFFQVCGFILIPTCSYPKLLSIGDGQRLQSVQPTSPQPWRGAALARTTIARDHHPNQAHLHHQQLMCGCPRLSPAPLLGSTVWNPPARSPSPCKRSRRYTAKYSRPEARLHSSTQSLPPINV